MVSSSRVLVLCTGNSARSIMAEATLSDLGAGRYVAYSAGSHPTGSPHPMALQVLAEQGHPADGLRSKSWDEFAVAEAPDLDLVVTVCDNARDESCPVWPGGPMTVHWGVEDPASFQGSEAVQHEAFVRVYGVLRKRVEGLLALDVSTLDRDCLQQAIQALSQVVE